MIRQFSTSGPLPVAVRRVVRHAVSGKKSDADTAGRLLMAIPAETSAELMLEVEAVLATADPRFWLALERARDWLFWNSPREPFRIEKVNTLPGLVVKAMFADGRVRERAVDLLAESSSLAAVPVLVLRAADWVPQVRAKARGAIIRLLAADPDGAVLATAAPMALLLAGRSEGRWLAGEVTDRLAADPTGPVVNRLLASPNVELRRTAYQVLLDADGFGLDQAVRIALTDSDVLIRARCAERASRLASDKSALPAMHQLLASRTPIVRAEALGALNRLDNAEALYAALSDRSSLVRGTARFYLRRRGVTDFADIHRRLIDAGDVTAGTVTGLAEVGIAADADLVMPLLSHPRARVRVETLRALITLSAPVDTARMLDLIENDPSPAVTRQAAAVILHRGAAVDAEHLLSLLALERRASTRMAAWHLLISRDAAWRLAVNVMLLDDADPAMAQRALNGLTAAMRQQLYTKPSGQAKDLLAAHLPKADRVLPPGEVRLLHFITGVPAPSECATTTAAGTARTEPAVSSNSQPAAADTPRRRRWSWRR